MKKFTRGYFFPLKLEFFARFGFNWLGKTGMQVLKRNSKRSSNGPIIAGIKMTEIVRCAFGNRGVKPSERGPCQLAEELIDVNVKTLI